MLTATVTESFSLENFIANPPEHMVWVDGEAATLPQSPPLIGQIASPTDSAEELFAKA